MEFEQTGRYRYYTLIPMVFVKIISKSIRKTCISKYLCILLFLFIGIEVELVASIRNVAGLSDTSKTPPCESPIYCIGGPGTLLHTVQMAKIYNDSKTFVDKPLKQGPNQTLTNFELFMQVATISFQISSY